MLHFQLLHSIFTSIFATLGLAVLITARVIGLGKETVFDADGGQRTVLRGKGLALLSAGHGLLTIALIVALVSGLFRLISVGVDQQVVTWPQWLSMGWITAIGLIAACVSPQKSWARGYWVATVSMVALFFFTVNIAIDLSPWRKLEIFLVTIGMILLGISYVGRFLEDEETTENESVTLGLWAGSMLAAFPLLVAVFYHWATTSEFAVAEEFVLITICILMLASGLVWRIKASTILGGGTLGIYLSVLVVAVIHQPQVAIGIYLAAGGGVLFLIGLGLALYRERLATLPERIANREGVFQIIGWR